MNKAGTGPVLKRRVADVAGALCLVMVVSLTIYLLFQDNLLPVSISTVWNACANRPVCARIIAVGLLPFYVAIMVFGAAAAGWRLSSVLRRVMNGQR